jgi:hypothetical protein
MKTCGMIWNESNDNEIFKNIVTLFNGLLNDLKIIFFRKSSSHIFT